MKEQIQKYLDTSGLLCPEPVMLLHKAVRELALGDVVEVIATDPSTLRDIPKFCHFLGHELLLQEEDKTHYLYYIKKAKE
jgi:tRNA 2-thiouridine synthesizing protein A